MPISKLSTLENTCRYFILAVDSYEDKQLSGRLYHKSQPDMIPFNNLIDLVWSMNKIFDQINYPMPTMSQRRFKHAELADKALRAVSNSQQQNDEADDDAGRQGRLVTIKLCIQYRYNASWQGKFVWTEKGESHRFESFLEMVRMLDGILDQGNEPKVRLGRRSCRIALDDHKEHFLSGRVGNSSMENQIAFKSVIQLVNTLDYVLEIDENSLPESWDKESVISNRTFSAYRNMGKKATFVIRILFRRNASWQGLIYWKETGETANFRSFLEMILLIDTAASDRGTWGGDQEEKAAH